MNLPVMATKLFKLDNHVQSKLLSIMFTEEYIINVCCLVDEMLKKV